MKRKLPTQKSVEIISSGRLTEGQPVAPEASDPTHRSRLNSNSSPESGLGLFKIGKVAVSPGDWIAWNNGPFLIQSKVCDNKTSSHGLQLYSYNKSFPEEHEGGFPIVTSCRKMTLSEVTHLPREVVVAADKFFADAKRFNFN